MSDSTDLSDQVCKAVVDKLSLSAGVLRVFGVGHGYVKSEDTFEGGACLEVRLGDEDYDVTVIVVRR